MTPPPNSKPSNHCPICNQQFEGDSHPCIGQISKRLVMDLPLTRYEYRDGEWEATDE